MKIALEKTSGSSYRLVLTANDGESFAPDVMVIDNPTRLVVDVPGKPSKAPQNVTVRDSSISAIRVGAHPDKTRIVLDIRSGAPQYTAEKSAHGAVVSFTFAGSADTHATSPENDFDETPEPTRAPVKHATIEPTPVETPLLKPSPTPKVTPTPKATPTPKPSPTPKARPTPEEDDEDDTTDVPPATPARTPAGVATPKQEAEPEASPSEVNPGKANPNKDFDLDIDQLDTTPHTGGGGTVKAIYYQTTNNTKIPAVAFDVDGLGSYSLNKKAPDLYELVLDNAHLAGNFLTLPQFPPDSFRGFSVIVARNEGGKVFVKIYVEEGVKLFPFIAKGQLWLKVSQ